MPLWTANLDALQAAADRLDPEVIRQRLDYWTLVLGPKFSKKERAAIHLRRAYPSIRSSNCRNFIFRRHVPIHKLFERSCEPAGTASIRDPAVFKSEVPVFLRCVANVRWRHHHGDGANGAELTLGRRGSSPTSAGYRAKGSRRFWG